MGTAVGCSVTVDVQKPPCVATVVAYTVEVASGQTVTAFGIGQTGGGIAVTVEVVTVGQRVYGTVTGRGQPIAIVNVCVVVKTLSRHVTVGVVVMPAQVGVPDGVTTLVIVVFGGSHCVRQLTEGVGTTVLEVGGL